MIKILKQIKKIDWIMAFSALAISSIGLLSLWDYSGEISLNFKKQFSFVIIGFFLMIFMSFFDWRALKESSFFILILYFIGNLLILGLFFFAPSLRGVKRWYVIGPLSFDPVEFFKIIIVILMAKFFSKRHVEMYKFSHIIFSGIYVLIPAVMVFLRPDMGTAIVLVAVWAGVLILSGIKIKHFLILILTGLLFFAFSWSFLLKDYQKTRVIGFLSQQDDVQGINWNLEQAKIAIGSGGLMGQGLGQGSQTRYGFLPERQTDFIFSAVAEEMGFFGVSILLILFFILIFRILKTGFDGSDNFSRLFCSGFVVLITFQIFINIGMNLGLLPVVGSPLPLVSYGGSNLIFTYIGLGIVGSIKKG